MAYWDVAGPLIGVALGWLLTVVTDERRRKWTVESDTRARRYELRVDVYRRLARLLRRLEAAESDVVLRLAGDPDAAIEEFMAASDDLRDLLEEVRMVSSDDVRSAAETWQRAAARQFAAFWDLHKPPLAGTPQAQETWSGSIFRMRDCRDAFFAAVRREL